MASGVSITIALMMGLMASRTQAVDWSGAPSLQRLSRAQLDFSLDLYRTLAAEVNTNRTDGGENIVMSPYSVMSLLSMLYLGSSGATSEQLRHALHFDNLSYVEVHRSYKKIVEGFRHEKLQVNLTIANKIFVQQDVNVSKVYGEKLLEYYDAALELVDFANNATFARDLVNTWVRVHTRGKINRLLDVPPSTSTKILLANAIHFQGFWMYKFDRKRTSESSVFKVNSYETLEVAMMVARLKVPHGYDELLRSSILELPYIDRRLSMFVLLPDEVDGLVALDSALTSTVMRDLMVGLKEDTVNVRLPRFKIESRLWLRDSLVKLGLNDLFVQDKADLSGLTSDFSDIFVSDVTHRTEVTITEEGSEAAASSALDVERIGYVGESYFEADHPFLFYIWDYQMNVCLFIGRVSRPSLDTSSL